MKKKTTKKTADVCHFSGYATKANVLCSDGRTIKPEAFKEQDGKRVPLVFQHQHDDPSNILGYAILEYRPDGMYAKGYFNDSANGQLSKQLVEHGDLTSLSIYANQLVEKGKNVIHGKIKEVSLVLAGANPEATIDNVVLEHSDGDLEDLDEAVIKFGSEFDSEDDDSDDSDDASHGEDLTGDEVFKSMTEDQKNFVYAIVAHMAGEGKDGDDDSGEGDDDDDDEDTAQHNDGGKKKMKKNLFDKSTTKEKEKKSIASLTHADFDTIVTEATKCGSFRDAFIAHLDTAGIDYGIKDIDILFPDAADVSQMPDWIKRKTEWVEDVLSGTHHSPFSRIRSKAANITAEEARAKGYIKGHLKKDEVFTLLKRVTTPTTIYKKQKLDRDDILDITGLDVVAMIKGEMRLMLDEEIARQILVGDGRTVEDEDKIDETCIRPIYKEADLYAVHVEIDELPTNKETATAMMDKFIESRVEYKGSGNPKLYTTNKWISAMLLIKDNLGHRLYKTIAELEAALLVSKIVEVPVMDGLIRETTVGEVTTDHELFGILVNLTDYNVGADKGGQVAMFDDFDIDYNQYKYLIETRCSGALTKPFSALIYEIKKAEG